MTIKPGEQPTNWLNVLKFVVTRPSRLPVLANKVIKRFRGEGRQETAENDAWLAANSIPAEQIAKSIAFDLWDEATEFDRSFQQHARSILNDIPHDLGGGGDHRFLYWLTRYRQPEVIVETGVAAGWSSGAFLSALRKNGHGKLYSSDLPYFRLPNPERFVGVVVDQGLRDGWSLHLEGDEVNLPRIVAEVDRIDIVHYDSDKSWSGRDFGIKLLRQKLAPNALILMDDIFNDSWFRTFVTTTDTPYAVIDGQYGIIGEVRVDGLRT